MGITWSSWAITEKNKLVSALTNSSKRSNVLLIGRQGAGKSALVTSLECAITENPGREVAPKGCFENGESYTCRLRRYEMFQDCGHIQVINDHKKKMPAIYDMPGFGNVDDKCTIDILRCILQGRVPSGKDVLVSAGMEATEIIQNFGKRDDESDHRIDRVIFVHSRTEPIPYNLIKGVVAVCKELDVTLFSVLSHYDQYKQCSFKKFAKATGIEGSPRGFEVQLYHSGMAKHGRYNLDYRTNYYMLLLWQMLLNTNYQIHSTN